MTEVEKICFLQIAHFPEDDRVWYHQAKSLKDEGFSVFVISTRIEYSRLENVFCFDDTGMQKSAVSKKIAEILQPIHPNLIICDNPLAVFFALTYRRKYHKRVKIVMDVTEWYPSQKNLVNLTGFKLFIKKTALKWLSFYSGCFVDGFIFGEYHKAKRYKRHFIRKPCLDLPYYPDLPYIERSKPKKDFSIWNFLYCGSLNKDKGFYNVMEGLKVSAMENQDVKFILTIISKDRLKEKQTQEISDIPNNLEIKFQNYLPFETFCKEIAHYDIFLDLREKDKENNQCLPIKLFYYMACGRPAVFSDLEAIRLHVPEIDGFAGLTNPNDYNNISRIITEYITNNEKYANHSSAALKYSNEKYNWGVLSDKFLKFILDVSN